MPTLRGRSCWTAHDELCHTLNAQRGRASGIFVTAIGSGRVGLFAYFPCAGHPILVFEKAYPAGALHLSLYAASVE